MGFRGGWKTAVRQIGALLFLGTALSAFATGAGPEPANPIVANLSSGSIKVTDIRVVRSSGGAEVQIIADRPLVHARSHYLSKPERFVLDLPDAVFAGDSPTVEVGSSDIKSIRVTPLFQQDGRIIRVVIDLAAPCKFEVATSGGGLTLKLASAGNASAAVRARTAPPPRPLDQEIAPASGLVAQPPVVADSGESQRERPLAEVAAEQRASLAQPATTVGPGKNDKDGAARLSTAATVAEFASAAAAPPRHDLQPAAAAISAQIADDNTHASVAELAVEKPDAEPTLAAENSPPDALIYGVGVTGRGQDSTLGTDLQQILGPQKQKKNKEPNDAGGRASLPPPFRLSGAAVGGYYQAESKGTYAIQEASPIGSVHLDASGYLYHPGLLTFSVRPQVSLGRQLSEGIFPDGRGVSATTTFLGGGDTPLTLSYSHLDRKLVAFGPLTPLAGLEANTTQDSASANWTLRLKRLPEISLSFSKYSDHFEPLANIAPETASDTRLGGVEMRETVMGWNLQSSYKLERSSQDLINIFDPTQAPSSYKRKDQEARVSADRGFGHWLSVAFLAGTTKSRNQLQDHPFDQSYRFLTGNSVVRPTKKLTLTLRAGVTNNIVGASLERSAGNTSTPDQPFLLVPLSARLEMVSSSLSAEYAITKDLRLRTDALRETTHPQQASATVAPESSMNTAQAGVSWRRRIHLVQFQTNYTANVGSFYYGGVGSSRSSGHKADLGATLGSPRWLELTASLQGSLQDITGTTYLRDRSWGTNLSLSHSFGGHWKLQAGYNRARDRYDYRDQRFSSEGNGFSLVFTTPRFDFSAAHNIRQGLTFQADPRLQYLSSSQAGILQGAFPGTLLAPSSADWSSASLSAHPLGKFRVRATWLRSRQQLPGSLDNRYAEWEASAGYEFRSINIDAGYIFHDQDFGVDLFQRNRIFFRVVRDFTVF